MGKIRDFQIVIDKNISGEHVFRPGDSLFGVVVVHLNEPSKISKLEIDICGKSSVNISIDNEHDNTVCDVDDETEDEENVVNKKNKAKKSKENKTKAKKQTVEDTEGEEAEEGGSEEEEDEEEEEEEEYESEEWHFRDNQVLWGGRRGTTKKMPIGRNEIRFEFQIPKGPLPTTFEGSMGFTRYWLEASIDPARFEFDQKAKLPFTIASHDIAFNDDTYLDSVTISKPESFLCCSCCPRRRKIHYSLTIDRSVYHPGDSILFSGEISNNSKETVKGQFCIYQRVTYHTKNGDNIDERAVDYKVVNDVERMETKKWTNSSLLIPPIPPSSNSRLIDIGYQVEMRLKIGDTKEKMLRIPMQISSAQVETKQFGGFSYYCGPVPNYGKSVFGRTQLKEDRNIFEAKSYTPMYLYYPPIGM